MLNNDVNPKTLSRIELLKLAQTLRVTDADVMTRAELRAAIERARSPEARQQSQPISWLGRARRLLASVIERGLHLPEAATLIRGGLPVRPFNGGPPPVATVTLARIYAAQGHLVRAIGILDEVLVSDPDHELARGLRDELQKALDERREQERGKQAESAASAAPEKATGAEAAAQSTAPQAEDEAEDEAPPSEARLAASELLGAVPEVDEPEVDEPEVDEPEVDEPGADEITLAGTGSEPAPPASAEKSAPAEEPEVAAQASAPSAEPEAAAAEAAGAPEAAEATSASEEELEPAAETRRASDTPARVSEGEAELTSAAATSAEPLSDNAETASESSPPSAAGSEPGVAPAAAAELPRQTGLVLIETSEPSAYLYWELAALANGAGNGGGEPHWVSVVTRAPRGARCERRERRFPVHHATGAVRIEGLPKHAVVRAKLSRGEAPDAPPLVVAGSVRVGSTADRCDDSALKRAQPGFSPHPAADPGALALRAAAHLADAAPLYY